MDLLLMVAWLPLLLYLGWEHRRYGERIRRLMELSEENMRLKRELGC